MFQEWDRGGKEKKKEKKKQLLTAIMAVRRFGLLGEVGTVFDVNVFYLFLQNYIINFFILKYNCLIFY